MKILITGADGFIGSHLTDFLLNKGLEVFATVHDEELKNLEYPRNKLHIIKLDINDRETLDSTIGSIKPDVIFHLAAQAYVMPSWSDIDGTFRTNLLSTTYLYESVREHGLNPVIIFASSSAGYGLAQPHEIPIKESKEFKPSSPYAVSKISADMISYVYWRAYGMKIIRARIFNTAGPRKRGNVVADFAKMVAEVENGKRDHVSVGNLDSVVDFTDVRDMVNALWTLAERGHPGEAYNICSGKGYAIKDILNKLIGFSDKKIEVAVDKEKIRPADDPVFIGDNTKLQQLGWKPSVNIDKTLMDTLEYWRNTVQ